MQVLKPLGTEELVLSASEDCLCGLQNLLCEFHLKWYLNSECISLEILSFFNLNFLKIEL